MLSFLCQHQNRSFDVLDYQQQKQIDKIERIVKFTCSLRSGGLQATRSVDWRPLQNAGNTKVLARGSRCNNGRENATLEGRMPSQQIPFFAAYFKIDKIIVTHWFANIAVVKGRFKST